VKYYIKLATDEKNKTQRRLTAGSENEMTKKIEEINKTEGGSVAKTNLNYLSTPSEIKINDPRIEQKN